MAPCLGRSEVEPAERAEICAGLFDQTGDPRAAMAAMEALTLAADQQGVADWAERLRRPLIAASLSPAQRAQAHKLEASALLRLGRGQEAMDAYSTALELFQQVADVSAVAECHYGLFYLSWTRSDLRSALIHADGAAEAARRAGNRALQANALQGLLGLQYDLGDLAGSWRTLKASKALLEKSSSGPAGEESDADRSARARLLVFEGTFLLDEQRPALARRVLERALELAVGSEESGFFRAIHLNLAQANLQLGDLPAGRDHWQLARDHVPEGESVPTALWAHLADLELRGGSPTAALEPLNRALGEEPVPDWRWRLQQMRGRALADLGRTEEADQAFAQAMNDVEKMRQELGFGELQAWLLDAKREPFERRFSLLAGAGRERESVAVFERAKARSFLDAFVAAGKAEATGAGRPQSSPGAAADRLAALQDFLPMVSSSPLARLQPLDRLLQDLKNVEVLAYFHTPEHWWALRYGAAGLVLTPLAGEGEMAAAIDAWQQAPDDPQAAAALARQVIPEEILPEPGTLLYLVTDRRLGEIAFAALPVAGEPLVTRYSLAYVPGLNALGALLNSRRGSRSAAKVLADPLGDLPSASHEARRVADRLGVSPGLGAAAGWQPGVDPTPSVLHLATHAGLGARGPWVELSGGKLYAPQVVAAAAGPPLVVLAGCSGAARSGDGLWGSMAGAFLAAGSRAVLASLWSVDDQKTATFIERFYAEGGIEDPVGALARSQRAWIKKGAPVAEWASFVLLGSGPASDA